MIMAFFHTNVRIVVAIYNNAGNTLIYVELISRAQWHFAMFVIKIKTTSAIIL